jgi:carotenoid cleavage dioxygenase
MDKEAGGPVTDPTVPSAPNRYLAGNFGPVAAETTLTGLRVDGVLPPHLDGRYLRNGPNPVTVPTGPYHWFLGSGMVHGLRLRDGRAEWYRNRWVRSADVADALGEDHHPGPVHAGMDFSPNTNVIGHGGRTFAIVEGGGRPYELTDHLDTVGPCDFYGTLEGGYTAHPHRDPRSGNLLAVSYFWGWGDRVQFTELAPTGRIERAIDLTVPGGPMMHDFSFTEDHVVLYDQPVTFDLDLVMAAAAGDPTASPFPYHWNPDHPCRLGIFSRHGDGSDLSWFDVDPCYVYHPVNAYDDGERTVLDVVRHASTMRTDPSGPFEGHPRLERWIVDRVGGKVTQTTVDDHPQEFPRIDERLAGRRHRYGYAPVDTRQASTPEFDGVARFDLETGDVTTRAFGPGCTASEFVFVPDDPGSPEDRGVLLGFVHHPDDTTRLAVLDAATLEDVATVHLPVRVPYGFHGNWIPTPT